jgi:RNA polymerase sigma-54 factor
MQTQRQGQKQSQQLKILPQQIQFLNLLHLSVAELDQYVERELEENPFLEPSGETSDIAENRVEQEEDGFEEFEEPTSWESMDDDEPDYLAQTESGFAGSEDPWRPTEIQHDSWREELKRQAHFAQMDAEHREVVDYLIDSLDESGFLRLSVDNIVDDFAFTRSQIIEPILVESSITILQALEPAGIGARDVRECLMLQLERIKHNKQLKGWATVVINQYLPQLAAHHYDPIMQALQIEPDEMSFVIDLVRSLNPKPLQGLADISDIAMQVQPDFLIEREGETLIASVLNSIGASVRISPDTDNYVNTYKEKTAKAFVRQKVDDARWLVEALKQRSETLLRTIQILVQLQRQFFLTGDYNQLKPMILKDIAEPLGMNVSTVSRITSTKYVQTEFGIIALKDLFFQTFTAQDGRELTNREVQEVIQEIVHAEDKKTPLNDTQIQEELEKRGIIVARRTVAKYREAISIPVADLRRGV